MAQFEFILLVPPRTFDQSYRLWAEARNRIKPRYCSYNCYPTEQDSRTLQLSRVFFGSYFTILGYHFFLANHQLLITSATTLNSDLPHSVILFYHKGRVANSNKISWSSKGRPQIGGSPLISEYSQNWVAWRLTECSTCTFTNIKNPHRIHISLLPVCFLLHPFYPFPFPFAFSSLYFSSD